jgi:hypothetical protein
MPDSDASRTVFRLQTNEDYHIFSGSAGERQVLIGLLYPKLVAAFFDDRGDFLGIQEQSLTVEVERAGSGGIFDRAFAAQLAPELYAWEKQLEYLPMVIHLREFFLENLRIGVVSPRSYWNPALQNPEKYPQLDREYVEEVIERWERTGQFVLWWGNDYYVDGDGRIIAS